MDKFIELDIKSFSDNEHLTVNSLVYSAHMNSSFSIELSCDYSGKKEINTEDLFGSYVSLTVSDGHNKRYFHGIVLTCNQSNDSGMQDDFAVRDVHIIVGPPLALMSRHYNTRVFSADNAAGYIRKIASDYRMTVLNPGDMSGLVNREFCIQYNESDFDFLNRLCESEGIFYYFQHGKNETTMKLGTGVSDYFNNEPKPHFGKGSGKIDYSNLNIHRNVLKKQVLVNDHDHKVPNKLLKSKKNSVSRNVDRLTSVNSYIFPHPVRSFNEDDERNFSVAEQFAMMHNEAEQSNYENLRLDIENNWDGLDLGYAFLLNDKNIKYIVTEYTLHITNDGNNSFHSFSAVKAIEFSAFRPLSVTPVPSIPLQTATVVGSMPGSIYNKKEDNADKNIYIKVKFHWDNDPAHTEISNYCSCWMRASQLHAGKNRGFVFVPRIGDEVTVAFECGHPDMPIITGSAYNGKNTTPYSLDEKKDISGIVSRTIPDGKESSSILFKDTAAKVELDDYTMGNRNTLAHKDISIKSNGNINIEGKSISLNAYDPESGKSSFITLTPELISVLSELVNENTGGEPNIIDAGELKNKVTPGAYFGGSSGGAAEKAAKKVAKEEMKNEKMKAKATKKSAQLAQKGAKQGVEAARTGDVSKVTVGEDAASTAAEMGQERASGI